MVQSPLNYTGGKYKLLPQILPHFPIGTHLFVDLFCGGCNVGLNAPGQRVVYNDLNRELLSDPNRIQIGQVLVLPAA